MTADLTHKQRRAIPALLSAPTVEEAAAIAGVSRESLYRWLRTNELFRDALHDAEAEALHEASRRLVSLTGRALTTIAAVMEDESAPPAIRLRAADMVLTRLMQRPDLADLNRQVVQSEQVHLLFPGLLSGIR